MFSTIRHPSEEPSKIIADDQVDVGFVLAQSPEQRLIMQDSTRLSVDQNEKATPKPGVCRTLTIASKYKGN